VVPDWLLAQYVMVEPETPPEVLPPLLLLQPVATSASDTAPTSAADSLVRRENFTVTPLCAWIGEIPKSARVRCESALTRSS
jgi:hypothetical protein